MSLLDHCHERGVEKFVPVSSSSLYDGPSNLRPFRRDANTDALIFPCSASAAPLIPWQVWRGSRKIAHKPSRLADLATRVGVGKVKRWLGWRRNGSVGPAASGK